jgi:hypothetical protein
VPRSGHCSNNGRFDDSKRSIFERCDPMIGNGYMQSHWRYRHIGAPYRPAGDMNLKMTNKSVVKDEKKQGVRSFSDLIIMRRLWPRLSEGVCDDMRVYELQQCRRVSVSARLRRHWPAVRSGHGPGWHT